MHRGPEGASKFRCIYASIHDSHVVSFLSSVLSRAARRPCRPPHQSSKLSCSFGAFGAAFIIYLSSPRWFATEVLACTGGSGFAKTFTEALRSILFQLLVPVEQSREKPQGGIKEKSRSDAPTQRYLIFDINQNRPGPFLTHTHTEGY